MNHYSPVYFDGHDPPAHITVRRIPTLEQYVFTCLSGHNTYQPTVPNFAQVATAARFAREHVGCQGYQRKENSK